MSSPAASDGGGGNADGRDRRVAGAGRTAARGAGCRPLTGMAVVIVAALAVASALITRLAGRDAVSAFREI
jgi:hypothetical protein